jgi:hypothetical protein
MGRGIEIQGCVSSRPRGSGSLPPPQSTEPTYVRVPRQVPTYPPHIRPNYCYWRKDCLGSHSTRCPLALDGDRAMSPLTRSVLTDVAISTWDTSYGHLAPRCPVAPSNVDVLPHALVCRRDSAASTAWRGSGRDRLRRPPTAKVLPMRRLPYWS